MNKRQAKKFRKKLNIWLSLDIVRPKCHCCENFESGDYSVGLLDTCMSNFMFDEDGNISEIKAMQADNYMFNGGYTCPHFTLCKGKEHKLQHLPKTYKELKRWVKIEEDLYREATENIYG